MNIKKQTLLTLLLIIIIAIYYLPKKNTSKPYYSNTTEDVISIDAEGDYDLEIISPPTETDTNPTPTTHIANLPVPDLNRPVAFNNTTSDEARLIISEKITKTVNALKEDNTSYEDWIELGSLYKIIEDYDGARVAWEYAGVVSPSSSMWLRNLGDLYGYYLNNPQKAEESLLSAIQKSPQEIEYYFKIVEFYRDITKNTAKARTIVKNGIISNPESEDLKLLLKTL